MTRGSGPQSSRSNSSRVARAGAALGAAQLIVIVNQVVYSGLVSRVLSADAFGQFAVAMNAVSLLGVVVGAGLPAAVVSSRRFDSNDHSAVLLIGVVSGLIAGSLVYFGAAAWALAWNSPEAEQITRLATVCAALSGLNAIQLALLRREQRTLADAAVQATAATLATVAGIVAVLASTSPAALMVTPTATVLLSLVLAATTRRERHAVARPARCREHLRFSTAVSTQSLVFWFILSSPTWAISIAFDAHLVGEFSRATVLTALPGMAFAAVCTRALQPYYRGLTGPGPISRAVADVQVVVLAVGLPIFAVVSVYSDELVSVWLGPGWQTTADMVRLMGVGAGVYAVFGVIASASETLRELRPVRVSQVAMATCVAGLIAVTIIGSTMWPSVVAGLVSGVVGLVTINLSLRRDGLLDVVPVRGLVAVVAIVVVSVLVSRLVVDLALVAFRPDLAPLASAIVGLGLGCVVTAVLLALSWRMNPAREVLARRRITRTSAPERV